MDLIKIEEREGKRTVNARNLHIILDSKQDFSHWITGRIEKYGFVKEEDFTIILAKSGSGRPLKEYYVSIDMAKELSRVERNDKGKEARQYFIDCEKSAKSQLSNLSPLDMFEVQLKAMRQQQTQIDDLSKKVDLIEASSQTTKVDYFTVIGYCSLKNIKVTPSGANAYGRKCAKYSKEYDYPIEKIKDSRYGQVNSYHIDVLSENLP